MESSKIGETAMTFYDLLKKDLSQLVLFAKNVEASQFLGTISLRTEFPIYADIIEVQLSRGRIRKDLLQRGAVALTFLVQHFDSSLDDVMEKILVYLNDRELRRLVAASKIKSVL